MPWLWIIVGIVGFVIYRGKGYWAAKTRNDIISWVFSPEGNCCECKHCGRDDSGRYSDTGYFCALSKCYNITEATVMNCFERPKITEADLNELFALGVWNDAGKQYLRQNLLGREMTWTELDNYLKQLPYEHPEFISETARGR